LKLKIKDVRISVKNDLISALNHNKEESQFVTQEHIEIVEQQKEKMQKLQLQLQMRENEILELKQNNETEGQNNTVLDQQKVDIKLCTQEHLEMVEQQKGKIQKFQLQLQLRENEISELKQTKDTKLHQYSEFNQETGDVKLLTQEHMDFVEEQQEKIEKLQLQIQMRENQISEGRETKQKLNVEINNLRVKQESNLSYYSETTVCLNCISLNLGKEKDSWQSTDTQNQNKDAKDSNESKNTPIVEIVNNTEDNESIEKQNQNKDAKGSNESQNTPNIENINSTEKQNQNKEAKDSNESKNTPIVEIINSTDDKESTETQNQYKEAKGSNESQNTPFVENSDNSEASETSESSEKSEKSEKFDVQDLTTPVMKHSETKAGKKTLAKAKQNVALNKTKKKAYTYHCNICLKDY
jgi:hypothetical protein